MTFTPPDKILYHNRSLVDLSREELIAACSDVLNSYTDLYQAYIKLKEEQVKHTIAWQKGFRSADMY